ncbi:MAG: NUDIX domain-containing protein, partial [Methylobacteriaceae bacterium]|nr:NUDIX domain-containing protein [Methylobacteriaceae bacterium]
PRGLLGGMTEFPSSDWSSGPQETGTDFPFAADWRRLPGRVEHVFTHFALHLSVHVAEARGANAPAGMRFIEIAALRREGLPSVMLKVAAHAGLLQTPRQGKQRAIKQLSASA